MNEQLKKLLKKLGFAEQVITDLGDEEKSKTLKVDDLYGELNTRIKTALENDSDFADTIHGKVRAEVLTSKERKIMKLFPKATKEIIEALPANRRFDALLEFLQENYSDEPGKGGAGGGNPDDKDKEILRLAGELKLKDEAIKDYEENKIPGLKKQSEDVIDGYRANDILRKKLEKKSLVVSVDVAYPSVAAKLAEKWDAKLNESKNDLTLFQKGKNLKAIKDTKEVVLDEELDEIITTLEIKKVSNAGKGGAGAGTGAGAGQGGGQGGGKEQPVAITEKAAAAKEHAASMFPKKDA